MELKGCFQNAEFFAYLDRNLAALKGNYKFVICFPKIYILEGQIILRGKKYSNRYIYTHTHTYIHTHIHIYIKSINKSVFYLLL